MDINKTPPAAQVEEQEIVHDPSRRRFFQLAGGLAGLGLVVTAASCRKTPAPNTTYLGKGDEALLNYLFVLKHVTVALYTQAVATPYYGITLAETVLQKDIRDQEVAHREFFRALLGKAVVSNVIEDLSPVTFADKTSFLTHASKLEDLTVAAYNGVIQLLTNSDQVLVLSKISSVDARHAGYMHDLLSHNSFAGDSGTDLNGLDGVIAPAKGMDVLSAYLQTEFDISKLPTF